jgi:hypothetical protein
MRNNDGLQIGESRNNGLDCMFSTFCICTLVKKELSSFETPLWLRTYQSAYGFRDIL